MRISCSDCDVPGVADLMRRSADKLAAVGANFLSFTDTTIHLAFVAERYSWLFVPNQCEKFTPIDPENS